VNRYLLLLKTPPPYGGGELQQEIMRKHYAGDGRFRIIELTSSRRDKTNQGVFEGWKVFEFVHVWMRVLLELLTARPKLLCMVMGKGFPHFLRDSLLVWSAWLLRIPVAVELHGNDFYFLSRRGFRAWYGRLVLSRIVCIRVLGESIRRRLEEHGVTNTVVLENGVETGAKCGDAGINGGESIYLLFVGTLSHDKGFDVLVEAGRILHAAGVSFQIHALGQWGSTEFEGVIASQLKRRGLERHFVFHGLKFGADKWRCFSECQVLVLPSLNEGQPLVILEGVSFGMAIVASDVGAIPDTIEDGKNGFLVPPGDAKRLAEALLKIIGDNRLLVRMRKENVDLFERRFSLERLLRSHEYWLELCCDRGFTPGGEYINSTR